MAELSSDQTSADAIIVLSVTNTIHQYSPSKRCGRPSPGPYISENLQEAFPSAYSTVEPRRGQIRPQTERHKRFRRIIVLEALMFTFLLWIFLLIVCWPLAIVALVLYPLVWLLLLPFRILGIAVDGVLELVKAIILLPARVLRGPRRAY